jgi:nucleotide-binding universal stress UspA family protein
LSENSVLRATAATSERCRKSSGTITVTKFDSPRGSAQESQRATAIACRLAADRQASITLVTVIEVPPLLPLDAYMTDEEEDARQMLNRAEAVGASYGVSLSTRILRAREAESAIVEQAEAIAADVVVIGSARTSRQSTRASVFGRTIHHVLKKAPCRVMLVAAKADVNATSRDRVSTKLPVQGRTGTQNAKPSG